MHIRQIAILISVVALIMVAGWQLQPVKDIPPLAKRSCPNTSLAEKLAQADVVMTGTVTGVLPVSDNTADVWVAPTQIYKGTVPTPNIKILARSIGVTGQSSSFSSSEDLHFQSDDPPYLLFLNAQPDGRYRTSRCDGSRLLGTGLTVEEQAVIENSPVVTKS